MEHREMIEIFDPDQDRPRWDYAAGLFESARAALAFVQACERYEGHAIRIAGEVYMKQHGKMYQWTGRKFQEVSVENPASA